VAKIRKSVIWCSSGADRKSNPKNKKEDAMKKSTLVTFIGLVVCLLCTVAVRSAKGITVFDSTITVELIGTFGRVYDIEYSNGCLYVLDLCDGASASPDHLFRINLESLEIDTVMHPEDFPSPYSGAHPRCLAWHFDGAFLIGDLEAGTPFRPGKIIKHKNGQTTIFVGNVLENPMDLLVVDIGVGPVADSSILVADVGEVHMGGEDGFVDRFSASGGDRTNILSGGDYHGLCDGPERSIYIGAYGHFTDGLLEVLKIDSSGVSLYFQDIPLGLNHLHLAFAPGKGFEEDLYVASFYGGHPDTNYVKHIYNLDGDGVGDSSETIAEGGWFASIAFDSSGAMYLVEFDADNDSYNVWRLNKGRNTLWVEDSKASVGQTGKVIRVFGKNRSELSGYSACMKFDPDVIEVDTLTLVGTRGEGAAMFMPGWTDTTAKAGVVYVYSCPGIPSGEGALLNLVVNIKDDAPVGPTTLELVDVPPALNRFSPCERGAITPTLVNGTLEVVREMFVRGDDDVDGELTISDPILSLCYQFADCPLPSCMDASDVDDDGEINISDPIRNLCYQFADCDPPAAPFPNCGPDPTEDGLDCASYPPCETKGLVLAKDQTSESGGKIEVKGASTFGNRKIAVPVYLTNTQPLSGFAYTIRYNNSILTAISVSDRGLFTGASDFSSAKINDEEGWVRIGNVVSYGMSTSLPLGNHQVTRLIFGLDVEEIKDDVALELVDGQFVDMKARLMRPKLVSGVIKAGIGLPKTSGLSQNYPNPFNPVTEISYRLPRRGEVTICIYNTMGQLVKTLVNEEQPAGFRTVRWNGKDNTGDDVSSGIYFCRMRTGGFVKTTKMVLMQ